MLWVDYFFGIGWFLSLELGGISEFWNKVSLKIMINIR